MRKRKKRTKLVSIEAKYTKPIAPTIVDLQIQLKKAKTENEKEMFKKQISYIKAWRKSGPQTVTYYPNRTRNKLKT